MDGAGTPTNEHVKVTESNWFLTVSVNPLISLGGSNMQVGSNQTLHRTNAHLKFIYYLVATFNWNYLRVKYRRTKTDVYDCIS